MASCSLAVDGDREPGWRLRPGLGGEPEATPEPAVREQVAQPLDAQPNQADPARAGAGPRRGRGTQAGRRQAAPRRGLRPPPRGPGATTPSRATPAPTHGPPPRAGAGGAGAGT